MVDVCAENQADDLTVSFRHPCGFEVQGFLIPAERFRRPRENVIGAEIAADHARPAFTIQPFLRAMFLISEHPIVWSCISRSTSA
jgi:hypothetical protein